MSDEFDLEHAVWRKSSFSSDMSCVEVAHVPWRKSSFSSDDNCVEVGHAPDYVAVRDSKNPSDGALVLTASAWRAFLAGAKRGEFDLSRTAR